MDFIKNYLQNSESGFAKRIKTQKWLTEPTSRNSKRNITKYDARKTWHKVGTTWHIFGTKKSGISRSFLFAQNSYLTYPKQFVFVLWFYEHILSW